jgi:hypothetical protein
MDKKWSKLPWHCVAQEFAEKKRPVIIEARVLGGFGFWMIRRIPLPRLVTMENPWVFNSFFRFVSHSLQT